MCLPAVIFRVRSGVPGHGSSGVSRSFRVFAGKEKKIIRIVQQLLRSGHPILRVVVPVGEFCVAVSLVSTEDFETGLSWARVATGPSRLGWPDQARPRLLRSERNYRTSVSVCAVERRGTKQRSCEKRRRTQQQQQHQQQQQ